MGKHGIVCDKGINDMERGWTVENKWNYKIYNIWGKILVRIYNEEIHEKQPTYINATLCLEWHWLSQFVKDIERIDGYNYDDFMSGKIELDKDIKSNGTIKEYSLKNCTFVSHAENMRQANKTRNYNHTTHTTHTTHKKHKKLDRFTLDNIHIDTRYQYEYVKMGFHSGNISTCCKWYECGENIKEWYKTHKNKPKKSTGGYIFKYHKEVN